MNALFGIAVFLFIACLARYAIKANHNKKKNASLLHRFLKKHKNKNHIHERIAMSYSNTLLIDPERNIQFGDWDKDEELREKADIHRARLSKFGRSKMNGEMLFLEEGGSIYKYKVNGEKEYI